MRLVWALRPWPAVATGTDNSRRSGRFLAALLLAAAVAHTASAGTWTDLYSDWHQANELRSFGHANSADLAWWESYLLQSYLPMFEATRDTVWLDRFVAHADTLFAVMRDVPDTGSYWPGYRDGFLGWGTTRYDPNREYQEYLVHDGQICLPVARFARLVLETPTLHHRYLAQARRYVSTIEHNIIAKWYVNWNARRGSGEDLHDFGGWLKLPFNQSLVFGELLLVLDDVSRSPFFLRPNPSVPAKFYSVAPESMALAFRRALLSGSNAAYVWHHYADTFPDPRWEDISHANLDLSFALEARRHGLSLTDTDIMGLSRTLTENLWDGSVQVPQFARFVNGSGETDTSGSLGGWLMLGDYEPSVFWLTKQAYETHPEWTGPASTSSARALVLALLAKMQPRFPDDIAPPMGLEETGSLSTPALSIRAVPNLFGEKTVIEYRLPASTYVSLRVLDSSGRVVFVLDDGPRERGFHQVAWSGTDAGTRRLPAGTYLCVLSTSGATATARVTLTR
jgi:hypothetical protein